MTQNFKNYSISSLVNTILSPALTSHYEVQMNLSREIKEFINSSGRLNGSFTDGELITLACSEAVLPGSSLATHDITNDRTGVSEKMAYRRLYDDRLDLTFYVDRNYEIIEIFEGWINYIVGEGALDKGSGLTRDQYKSKDAYYRMNYPKFYKISEFYVKKFERDYSTDGKLLTYQFIDIFPIAINSIPISYDSSQLLKCTVSFSYTRYVRYRTQVTSSISSGADTTLGAPDLPTSPISTSPIV